MIKKHSNLSLFILLLFVNINCSGQQNKIIMKREQQKEILIQMAKEEAAQYKNYAEKPMYYLQINKSACRLIVNVNDIPLGYYFNEDAGESMLHPINDHIRQWQASIYHRCLPDEYQGIHY
jgi:hypothetical protein